MATQVNEYDCLLLEHVFGQRPDDAHKVKAFVLETIASDPSLQQTELLFLGLFGRACRVMDSGSSAVRPLPLPTCMSLHQADASPALSCAWTAAALSYG